MGATAQEIPKWQRWDVVGRRRLWFILSLVAIGVSIVALARPGPEPRASTSRAACRSRSRRRSRSSIAAVREQAAAIGHGDAVVQGRGDAIGGDQYKSFQIRLKKLNPAEQDAADERRSTNRLDAEKLGVKNVSSSFSRQILRGAIIAIIVSFALIALFVTLRYQWRFAVPILRTLVNDVLITLGVYAISGREVSASTVAALLTILGYSIYDTIIVFDRVRENMRLMPRAIDRADRNVSVWEVLRRSIFTSVITLLPIAALYIFGGATLQDFAFAIMVGIVVGAVGDDLHRDAAAGHADGARPRVRAPQGQLEESEAASAAPVRAGRSPPSRRPTTPIDAIEDAIESITDADVTGDERRDRRRRTTATATASSTRARRRRTRSGNGGASVERRGRMDEPGNGSAEPSRRRDRAREPRRATATRSSACSRSSARASTRCARCSATRPRAGAATRCGWARARGSGCATSSASSASSRATTGTSSSSGSPSSSTG